MGKRSPLVIDYLAFIFRFVAKIIALTLIYSLSAKTGAEVLAMLVLMLGEVYHVVVLAISVVYPQKRSFIYSIVGVLDAVLLCGGLWFLGNVTSDAYLLVLFILIPLVMTGGLWPALVTSITTVLIYGYLMTQLHVELYIQILRTVIMVYGLILLGLISEWYHQNFTDIQRLNEQDIIRERANAVREKFTIVASHNLKTPLSSIKESFGLIKDGHVKKEGVDDVIRKMVSHTSELERFMEQLLRLSAINTVIPKEERSTVDLQSIISSVRDLFSPQISQRDIEFIREGETGRVMITVNDRLFREVFINLIDNAIRVVSDGGVVAVKVDINKTDVKIHIADNGPGVSKEVLPYMFTQFNRVGEELQEGEWSGLGLYIAKSIVEAHEGTISVESALGVGTSFTISLPVTTENSY
ncbi:HAMP domain-containing histidine kinase [bacterium]|uniref:histidine kinase n=2 Tax=Katanobacteria TaxID=422282 RepID=A0A2M7X297_UNCKA|nr:HAMP domain-containing histidine kinase [bacterium]PIP56784.1 MAG: hypothetical protein COX05_01150 [candidate division WWE3 bacterium CG22_combo_CG10-13_8_21_14_all_39_12]PJA40131.1 MAG: hypothetical protein CO179_03205 [candidate division WWE3 bacterium CG_4_9_14_3_um_filter_39_7]